MVRLCVSVCSMSYVLAVGSSVVFQPHTINMSLWWGRGAPETLTCGGAALTAIDKEVRRILGMECPGGKSFIGGRLMMSLEDVIASFLSASRFMLFLHCILWQISQSHHCLLISDRVKNAFNHYLPASETNTKWHGSQSAIFPSSRTPMTVFLYLFVQMKKITQTPRSQRSLQENCLYGLNVRFGRKQSEQIRSSGICAKRQTKCGAW